MFSIFFLTGDKQRFIWAKINIITELCWRNHCLNFELN